MKKLKKKEISVKRLSIKHLEGDVILLYRLIEDKLPYKSALFGSVYSISVTKIDCGGKKREVRRVYDVTRCETEAERIFSLISRGRVTPCCLLETIEDLIS